jgi:hypothetical protein
VLPAKHLSQKIAKLQSEGPMVVPRLLILPTKTLRSRINGPKAIAVDLQRFVAKKTQGNNE